MLQLLGVDFADRYPEADGKVMRAGPDGVMHPTTVQINARDRTLVTLKMRPVGLALAYQLGRALA